MKVKNSPLQKRTIISALSWQDIRIRVGVAGVEEFHAPTSRRDTDGETKHVPRSARILFSGRVTA